ncbi:hypothetical protein [Pseudohaliea rubra]|uniref:hypothetical protein n=1 Tax=Pseudohaliea rubra TaxID=475795 RepID=UPI0011848A30|nr:hypothetical protein [Pseudohaliea rubra]
MECTLFNNSARGKRSKLKELIGLDKIKAQSLLKALSLTGGLLIFCLPRYGLAISVSVSDTVVVLDSRHRSGEIQLLSMTPSPVEFEITPIDVPEGALDGSDYLRWSPPRVLVPANRGRPLRMVFRPPADLPPGEYIARLAVKSRQVDYQPDFDGPDKSTGADETRFSVGVAIQPVLPLTVYIRHQIEQPELTISAFMPAPNQENAHGHFLVKKNAGDVSFIGTVSMVGQNSGEILSKGRLRISQTASERRVRVPRREGEGVLGEPVCLYLWDTYPPRGRPVKEVCGE